MAGAGRAVFFSRLAMTPDDRTSVIQNWIDRLGTGDKVARGALLGCAGHRLTLLARRMLRGFPGVSRWEETDDVVQNALIRLDRALRTVAPTTAAGFFRLATVQIRRELLDLARHYSGPEGLGTHYRDRPNPIDSGDAGEDPSDSADDPCELAAWTEFHRQAAALPEDDRAVFDLLWYQGLTHAEAAGVLGFSERTIGRRWLSARSRLSDILGDDVPD
jgi:RNA polymerase sigma factor (sigma-70 family)